MDKKRGVGAIISRRMRARRKRQRQRQHLNKNPALVKAAPPPPPPRAGVTVCAQMAQQLLLFQLCILCCIIPHRFTWSHRIGVTHSSRPGGSENWCLPTEPITSPFFQRCMLLRIVSCEGEFPARQLGVLWAMVNRAFFGRFGFVDLIDFLEDDLFTLEARLRTCDRWSSRVQTQRVGGRRCNVSE